MDKENRTNSNLFLTSAPAVVSALAVAAGVSAALPEDCCCCLEALLRTINFIWRLTAIALYACCKGEKGTFSGLWGRWQGDYSGSNTNLF